MTYLIALLVSFFACQEVSVQPGSGNQNPAEPPITKKFLALGDSYTIGQSVPEEYRWPNLLQDSLEVMGIDFKEPQIIATTGWRTDQLLRAAITEATESDYGLVSLLIGVNNQFQGRSVEDYRPEFEELLQFAIARAGGDSSRVFVLSIPDYGCTPFGESRAEQIGRAVDQFNDANKEITENYGVAYFDITGISREGKYRPELVASDGLHPSGEQYILWVQEVLKNPDFISAIN